jgi:hypothetical protein
LAGYTNIPGSGGENGALIGAIFTLTVVGVKGFPKMT